MFFVSEVELILLTFVTFNFLMFPVGEKLILLVSIILSSVQVNNNFVVFPICILLAPPRLNWHTGALTSFGAGKKRKKTINYSFFLFFRQVC